jgi:hypothetical protein
MAMKIVRPKAEIASSSGGEEIQKSSSGERTKREGERKKIC